MTLHQGTVNVPFSDIQKERDALFNEWRRNQYPELSEDNVRALIAEYCETLEGDKCRERLLRPVVSLVLKSTDMPPDLIRDIVEKFFDMKRKNHSLWLSTRPVMMGLVNPNCPPDLLVVAFLSPYRDLVWAAELNPNLPVEYQVMSALKGGA